MKCSATNAEAETDFKSRLGLNSQSVFVNVNIKQIQEFSVLWLLEIKQESEERFGSFMY